MRIMFAVVGTPRSAQAAGGIRSRVWADRIATASRAVLPPEFIPTREEVATSITYYHEGEAPGVDIDNIVKPIHDALNGIVYEDDRQVFDFRCRRVSLRNYEIAVVPEALLAHLSRRREFLWIEIFFGEEGER